MRNSPLSFDDQHGLSATGDRLAGGRLLILWIAFFVPLVAVGTRLAQLQLVLQPAFVSAFDVESVTVEAIPSRNGRILTADGTVLAEDVPEYELQVHYRFLQQPFDASWLRTQALNRLPRPARRNPELVAHEIDDLRAQYRAAWSRLANKLQVQEIVLAEHCSDIQCRIERMRQKVAATRSAASVIVETAPGHWCLRAWREITAPPRRNDDTDFVLAEEQAYHPLPIRIAAAVAREIETSRGLYPFLRVAPRWERHYPHGSFAAHWIGHRRRVTEEELGAVHASATMQQNDVLPNESSHASAGGLANYRVGESTGRSGLEQSYDRMLHAIAGERRITRNRRGEIVREEIIRDPQPGGDLVLEVDFKLQHTAESLLDRALGSTADREPADDVNAVIGGLPVGAALVALDVQTGAILTAAAAPRFDANIMLGIDAAGYNALEQDPRRPFFPRATHMALPPGSIFKVLSAIALLESGTVTPDAPVYCQGYLDHPHQHRCLAFRHFGAGHGEMRLADALCRSCNVYFFRGARQAGIAPLIKWAEHSGFGQPTGVDLPSESGGFLPRPARGPGAVPWYPGTTLGLAIGQSSLKVTPLQMCRLMALVANNGALVTPHFAAQHGAVNRVGTADRRSPSVAMPSQRVETKIDADNLLAVREGLDMVVNDSHGTGYKTVRLDSVRIAGKTGTAETGGGRPDHAWFAGYAPADHPRVAFVVVLEHGGSGSKAAGPIARQYVQALLDGRFISKSAPLQAASETAVQDE